MTTDAITSCAALHYDFSKCQAPREGVASCRTTPYASSNQRAIVPPGLGSGTWSRAGGALRRLGELWARVRPLRGRTTPFVRSPGWGATKPGAGRTKGGALRRLGELWARAELRPAACGGRRGAGATPGAENVAVSQHGRGHLAAGAEDNIQVCNLSTPAQYFHLLRHQAKTSERRPLIVMTPKSLLRRTGVISSVDELISGHLHEVIADPKPPEKARRLVLCTGKIYYDLYDAREEAEETDTSLVRVEQLYPFPGSPLVDLTVDFEGLEEVVWVQEEPANRGAWPFMQPRLRAIFPDLEVGYVGRPASASPATGSLRRHRQQQAEIVAEGLRKKT